MIFAVIGDVRSNFSALEAVLADIEEEGIHLILQTGNLALGSPEGDRVVDLLREQSMTVVQGTEDRQTVMYRKKEKSFRKRLPEALCEEMAVAQEYLSSRNLEYLGELQRVKKLQMDELHIVCSHGAPSSPSVFLEADSDLARFQREREVESPDIIVTGGSAAQYSKLVGDTLFVGSGTLVDGSGQAGYTLVSTEARPWSAEWVGVPT